MGRTITQDQLDRLFTSALEAAIGRIERDGHFHPLVFELRSNGAVHAVAVLETGEVDNLRDPVDRLVELLRPRTRDGTIAAAAIVRLFGSGPVAEVRLRTENYSADIEVPFVIQTTGLVRRRRRVSLGEFTARPAENDVFGGTR